MNKSNFTQTGGYPLKTERLQEMETAYSIFNSLGALAGNLTVISGCALTGTTIGNGVVHINGELLEFRQATVTPSSTVIVVEEAVNRGFKNGVVKQVYAIRYATFGTADTSFLWSLFKRIDPLIVLMARLDVMEKKTAVFQAGGGMVLWNKPAVDIPAGWQEVVDWRGRMPVGFDASQPEFDTMGETGGAKNKTLTVQELPKHNFLTFSPANTALNNNTVDANTYPVADSDGSGFGNEAYRIRRSGTRPTLGKSSDVGGDQEFSLLNPYRTVLFIEFIE
jgi:hypothetical protein